MAYQWSKNSYEQGESWTTNNDNGGGDCQKGYIPPGFRFCPTDEELIDYLSCKLKGLHNPEHKFIEEVNIYAYSPMELSEKYKLDRENEWYFFTPRSKKYQNGERPDRFAKDGYWKPTANGKSIRDKKGTGKKIGNVRTLSFRTRFEKDKTDQKSEWLMHEYTLDSAPTTSGKMFDKWVIVKIYRKRGASNAAESPRKQARNDIQKNGPSTFDASQPLNMMPYPTAPQLQLGPSQSLGGLQNQSSLSQPGPIQAIGQSHPSSFGYFNDMGLQDNPNFGFNSAFPRLENQQRPSLQQMHAENGVETAIRVQHPDGLLRIEENETGTAAPHFDEQFYGPQTLGINETLSALPNPGGTFNDVDQPSIDNLNLFSHGKNNNNQTIPHPANNNEPDLLAWMLKDDEWLNFNVHENNNEQDPLAWMSVDDECLNFNVHENNNEQDPLAWVPEDDEWLNFNVDDIDRLMSTDVLLSDADYSDYYRCEFSNPMHPILP